MAKKKSFREFLKGLELEDDTIDTIMAEFGAQRTLDLEKITTLETQINQSGNLQSELNNLKTKYDNDTKSLKAINAKNKAVFSKFAGMGKIAELLMAKIDLDKIELDDGGKVTKGLDDQYDSLIEEYKDFLHTGSSGNEDQGGDGGLPGGTTPPAGKKPEEMTMDEYILWRNKK